VDLQVVLLDDQSRPYNVEELLLRHDAVAALDQRIEKIECPSTELRGPPVDQHDACMPVDANLAGMERKGLRAWTHRLLSHSILYPE
jgi:hypothetical protein